MAVGHLILRVAFQMLKSGTKFDPEKLGLEQKLDDNTGEELWVKKKDNTEKSSSVENKKVKEEEKEKECLECGDIND